MYSLGPSYIRSCIAFKREHTQRFIIAVVRTEENKTKQNNLCELRYMGRVLQLEGRKVCLEKLCLQKFYLKNKMALA